MLDAALLYFLKNEISAAVGSRIDKIFMPSKDKIVFHLSSKGFSKKLLLCANSGSARIHFTNESFENPAVPPMLCMLLRKILLSAKLRDVRQPVFDRVLFLDFDAKNELGDDVLITVVIEIMGGKSNIIIIKNSKILDAVKRVDPSMSSRFILPNAEYEPPPPQNKMNILYGDIDIIADKIMTSSVSETLCGMSKTVCREIEFLTANDRNRLVDCLIKQKELIINGGEPVIVFDKENNPILYTYMRLKQYGEEVLQKKYESYGELLDEFYYKKDRSDILRTNNSDLLKLLSRLSARILRKIESRKKDLQKTEKREQLRQYGELINANLYKMQTGDSHLTTQNYFDSECRDITIPLDVALSPAKNAQKYFKEYKKKTTAAGMLCGLIEEAQKELVYIESVSDALNRAKTKAETDLIREEIIQSGYLKKSGGKKQKSVSLPLLEYEYEGYKILAGRNNKQNDELTFKIAAKSDIWLHVKNLPGSHVVIITNGEQIEQNVLQFAANIAVENSKASGNTSTAVDYTYIKNVKKIPGGKPGMVTFSDFKTIFSKQTGE